mmetsp:Transcript_5740/g.7201  ORF Transcript_5740/g.7201 Transcript_5740/m.7201 type:complete len:89 (-) Transcript_5740:617-883(-)
MNRCFIILNSEPSFYERKSHLINKVIKNDNKKHFRFYDCLFIKAIISFSNAKGSCFFVYNLTATPSLPTKYLKKFPFTLPGTCAFKAL